MLVPGVLAAQGAVSGRVTIQEREGETTKDLATAVIYLETAVPAGSTVAFPNQDPFRHNVFSNSSGGAFDLGLTPRGGSSRNLFRRPGVYAIYCNIHSRMSAFVVAVATPYYTQPGADGTFTLPSVPAGRYVLHVWHERGGDIQQKLEVPAAGVDGLAAVLDSRGYQPAQHKNKFGLDYAASDDDERY